MTEPADNIRGIYLCYINKLYTLLLASIGNYKGVMLCSRPNEDLYIQKEKLYIYINLNIYNIHNNIYIGLLCLESTQKTN